jgi:hypothetical protein
MAKSLLSTKSLKKKPARKSKSENYLVNWKYLGEEPKNVSFNTVDLLKAFNWYNVMAEKEDTRQYLKDYFKSDNTMVKMIDRIPDSRLPTTSAWLCRIASNQNRDLEPNDWVRVNDDIKIASGYNTETEEDKAKPVITKPSIQERVKERVQDIIGDVEALLDSGEKFNMYEWLQKNEIPAMHANKIADYYEPLVEEYNIVISGDKEGYERYTKKQMQEKHQNLSLLLNDCRRFAGNVKKARAPRKKKAPTTEKLLKHFAYLKAYNEFKLQSIDPATIIGAQELWTFDTKYNKLTVFRARGPAGLSIKRTAIDGYDIDNTVSKRIGRKTEETLKKVLSGGKIILRKLMDDISSDPITLSDRINNSIVLLKATR